MPISDFSYLYSHSYPYLYQLVASIYCNPCFIEDILQEIYLAAWEHFQISTHPNPLGWLVVTARHKAYDMMRRQMRETQKFIPLGEDADLALGFSSSFQEPMSRILEREGLYPNIRPLLSEDELTLLVAYYDEGFSVADLSRRMNISDHACYMRLHRARKKLEPLINNAS